ncbi:hypothetical protein DTO166G4_7131 [Paecilomyces variotii]|nr:hypothetical protein DTO164E3_8891 [Paecilomyces variotii]KAJ9211298.1 hypothetical protein DTO166G4_7131 [Paecilomyces variotii]KAJ9238275.1 hypothetical protein DTO169E5_4819 [Paecilomyces variotii]KAJ9241835.1 hypothetical protein DTO166G5_911 [Paecilomyces variotii]KAJ9309671.1 hypothetical protein DTO217A2_961 [Paecilomyces variotii]
MQHVGLFYHLLTETFDSLRLEFAGVHIPFHKLFKEAVSAPYLMNELLALAAIHRSTLSPSEQTFYRDQATELQTYALSIFNATKPQINAETCVPMFLFSSVLGIHEMCETFVFRETDFELFVEKFVRYLCLHQGVKVVTRGTWHILRESVLGPLLKQGETILPTSTALGEICSRLQHLVKSANLSQEDIASCEQAISSLQSVLDAAPLDVQGRLRMNAILSWPVILSQGYTDLLRQREPHALVILAHYAAVVHSRRDMWMCGDGGAYLVKLIAQHLGEDWSDWLFWPHQAVSDSSAIITSSLEQD